ncbi:DNA adenine methylase [Hyphomicrobium sp. CS1BSMeth3]|uniref:DNA adenine methylase n=1 Tax=Hyphomicrobium sp. CS1BSMeth3 TaxID=1892844 RepID=UPI000931CCED|nr:DNA adenine methylase [Hyphomicrobium sp. CS1BSMeth3]
MQARLPHPVPYQGSKRTLAPRIGVHAPRDIDVWFEPFAGSAAMTLWALEAQVARRYVIADVLAPIAGLWRLIIDAPVATAERYGEIWRGQKPSDRDYFNAVRARYNAHGDPVDLLYLICRCVKNAVRFNAAGQFTQSVDRRRLGMRPERMMAAIAAASQLMRGRTEVRSGDWLATTADAGRRDFVYLDPPYLGTTVGRDRRYVRQLQQADLIEGIEALLARGVRFMLSYDGMTGAKSYGAPLPEALGLTRLLLEAGTSAQATLSGRAERTLESLYLSPGLRPPCAPCSALRELGGPSS